LGLKQSYDNWFEYCGANINNGVSIVLWPWKASYVGLCCDNHVFIAQLLRIWTIIVKNLVIMPLASHCAIFFSNGVIQLNEYISLVCDYKG
jgi:hypothetical protein